MDDTEELDWGDDEHPLIVDTDDRDDERDDDIDDDRADAVSLDDGSDDLPDYASFQLAHKNPIAVASPPTRHSATTKSPGLPPKPVASEKAPYLPSSHPSLTEASAMSSTFKRGDLPQHWELRRSRGGGDTYYYNTKTHESTWSKPASPKAGRRPASPLSSLPPRPAPYRSAPDSKPDRKARSRERRGMDSYRPQYSPSPERRPRDRPHPSLPSPPPRSLRRSPASTALPHTTRQRSPPPRSTRRSISPPPRLAADRPKRDISPRLNGVDRDHRARNRSLSPPSVLPRKRRDSLVRLSPSPPEVDTRSDLGSSKRRRTDLPDHEPRRDYDPVSVQHSVVDPPRRRGPPLPPQHHKFKMSRASPLEPSEQVVPDPLRSSIVASNPPAGPRSRRSSTVNGNPRSGPSHNVPPAAPRSYRDSDFVDPYQSPPTGLMPRASKTRQSTIANSQEEFSRRSPEIEGAPRGPRAMDSQHYAKDNLPSTFKNPGRATASTSFEAGITSRSRADRRVDSSRKAPPPSTEFSRGTRPGKLSGANNAHIGERRMRVWGKPVETQRGGDYTEDDREDHEHIRRPLNRSDDFPADSLRLTPEYLPLVQNQPKHEAYLDFPRNASVHVDELPTEKALSSLSLEQPYKSPRSRRVSRFRDDYIVHQGVDGGPELMDFPVRQDEPYYDTQTRSMTSERMYQNSGPTYRNSESLPLQPPFQHSPRRGSRGTSTIGSNYAIDPDIEFARGNPLDHRSPAYIRPPSPDAIMTTYQGLEHVHERTSLSRSPLLSRQQSLPSSLPPRPPQTRVYDIESQVDPSYRYHQDEISPHSPSRPLGADRQDTPPYSHPEKGAPSYSQKPHDRYYRLESRYSPEPQRPLDDRLFTLQAHGSRSSLLDRLSTAAPDSSGRSDPFESRALHPLPPHPSLRDRLQDRLPGSDEGGRRDGPGVQDDGRRRKKRRGGRGR